MLDGPLWRDSLMTEEERETILKSISSSALVCELGSYRGASIRHWAEERPRGKFVAIDTFRAYDSCISCAMRHQQPNVSFFVGRSRDFAAVMRQGSYDVVVVDGDHSYEGCLEDLRIAGELVNVGGVIWAHDYRSAGILPGVTRAVDEFCTGPGWKIAKIVHSLALLVRK